MRKRKVKGRGVDERNFVVAAHPAHVVVAHAAFVEPGGYDFVAELHD